MNTMSFKILKKEIEKKLANDLRHLFLESIKNVSVFNDYDERDIEKLKKNNVYFHLYIRARQGDIDRAYSMMVESLKWRKSYKINGISEENLDNAVLKLGLLYYHNFDKKRNSILVFHGNRYLYKDDRGKAEDVQNVFAYLLEKQQKHHVGNKITVICDHTDATLENMDLDFFKFMVNLFSIYYPDILDTFIVLNVAWRISAAWKMIRSWLSNDMLAKFKFLDKSKLSDYVDQRNILVSMDGEDDFKYTVPPIPDNTRDSVDDDKLSSSSYENDSSQEDLAASFEEREEKKHLLEEKGHSSTTKVMGGTVGTQLRQRLKDNSSKTDHSMHSDVDEGEQACLVVSPKDEIVFREVENESEIQETVTLVNKSSESVIFKIKTNSPTNFRARPNVGGLLPGSSKEITLMLLVKNDEVLEKHASVKDKFLILHSETSEVITNSTDISELWKYVPKMDVHEHKLCCRVLDVNGFEKRPKTIEDVLEMSLKLKQQISQLDSKLDQQNVSLTHVIDAQQQQKLMLISILTVILLACLIFWFR